MAAARRRVEARDLGFVGSVRLEGSFVRERVVSGRSSDHGARHGAGGPLDNPRKLVGIAVPDIRRNDEVLPDAIRTGSH
jgi:hypothetical protein